MKQHNITIRGPEDGQPIVFAHGFGCDQNMWRFVAPRFEEDFRVVVFDHAGSGGADPSSYDVDRHASLTGYADDVLAIVRELDLTDVVFVGHSVSSMIGALAAIEEPERFDKLVFVGPSPRYIDGDGYVGGFSPAGIDELLDALQSNYLGWSSAMAPVIMGNDDRPELGQELTESFCRTDPEIAQRFARATFFADNRDDLPKVTVPTLVLQCSDDVIAPVAVGEYVRDTLPNSSYRLLRATGHCPNLSAPDETTEAIADFVRGLSVPDRKVAEVEVEAALGALLDDDPEAFYERAPCGYISTTPVGTIVKVNQTFLDWTGHRREDLVGQRSFVDLLSIGGRIYHETHYRPLLEMQGTVREIAVEMVTADDGRLPVLVNSVLERDEAGHPVLVRTAVFEATERRRYERELVAAKQRAEQAEAEARAVVDTLQRSLTPPALPTVDGLELAAVYRPVGDGGDLGGDFFDAVQAVDGSWLVVVGDVLGKGVEAAVVTGLARHALQAAALSSAEPSEVLAVLNEVLRRSGGNRFVTVALLKFSIHADQRKLTVALGGHHPPLICRPGQPPEPIGEPGSVLGVFVEPTFPEVAVELESGDLVVSCTDGITEARTDTEFFGEDGFRDAVDRHRSSARSVAEGVLADALEFSGGRRDDDIVVVAVRAT